MEKQDNFVVPDTIKNRLGMRYGKLLVVAYLGVSGTGSKRRHHWKCKCDCGNSKVLHSRGISAAKSCGCARTLDIAGKVFGRLTAVRNTRTKCGNGDYLWSCICSCGNTCEIPVGRLQYGGTRSCGCLKNDILAARVTTHRKSRTPEYRVWCKIRERCYNRSSKDYPDYGGRGITVCKEWLHSFESFIKDVGEKPDTLGVSYSIDRIDVNGNYEPGNVRWATEYQQARNKRPQKNNTSGVRGVRWEQKKHPCGIKKSLYATASWYDLTSRLRKKAFPVKKYGEELAFLLACEFRLKQIEILNAQGADYPDNYLTYDMGCAKMYSEL